MMDYSEYKDIPTKEVLSKGKSAVVSPRNVSFQDKETVIKSSRPKDQGTVPNPTINNAKNADQKGNNNPFVCENMRFDTVEAYKLLRTNIQFSFTDNKESHVIGITSALVSEGKSLTAINLAYSLAQLDKNVLLVNGDLRLPSIEKTLGLESTPGLSNLLVGMNNINSCIRQYVPQDGSNSFDILVSGDVPPNPSELLSSNRMKKLLEKRLKLHYEYIIFDLPPVESVSDAISISKLLDGMVLVVRENYAERDDLDDCIKQLQFADVKIIGFVMNAASENSGKRYYKKGKKYGKKYKYYTNRYGGYGYRYGYTYGYGYRYGSNSYNTQKQDSKKDNA